MSKPFIDVAAGLILREDGSLLLAERPQDKPWSGWWELPGGKLEAGETVLQALARELKEELGIDVKTATPWVTYIHEYPKDIVRLAFCRVTQWSGTPAGVEGQTLTWVNPHKALTVGPLLPATQPPLRWLQLPDHYLITSIGSTAGLPDFIEKLSKALQSGVSLVQFREPGWADNATEDDVRNGFLAVLECCHRFNARCLVNSMHPESWRALADGVHWRAQDARREAAAAQAGNSARTNDVNQTDSSILAKNNAPGNAASSGDQALHHTPNKTATTSTAEAWASDAHLRQQPLVGVSAHNAKDLAAACALNADFAVLGHVLETPSHVDEPGMGWDRFASLVKGSGLPVFAIGGQSDATLAVAREHGAHGIAGIRGLLNFLR